MSLIRSLLLALILLIAPAASENIYNIYVTKGIASFAVPLTSYGRAYCSASNMYYKGKVYLVTNMHCCAANREMSSFKTVLETEFINKHKVLHVSKQHDVCIAESNSKYGLPISTTYGIGDEIMIIGHPRGLPQTIRHGRIYTIGQDVFPWLGLVYKKFIGIDATGYPGNSGSPLMTKYGVVIGIVFSGRRGIHTEMGAVPAEYIIKALDVVKYKENLNNAKIAVEDVYKI